MKSLLIDMICILILTVLAPQLCAQKLFTQLVMPAANGYITSMVQDKQGYNWYGYSAIIISEHKGLNRYDGLETITYYYKPKDSNPLASNQIWSMYTDTSGKIWIGMIAGGLDRLYPLTHNFKHFRHNQSSDIISSPIILKIS